MSIIFYKILWQKRWPSLLLECISSQLVTANYILLFNYYFYSKYFLTSMVLIVLLFTEAKFTKTARDRRPNKCFWTISQKSHEKAAINSFFTKKVPHSKCFSENFVKLFRTTECWERFFLNFVPSLSFSKGKCSFTVV